ncbi:MAG TPA: nascent polypeptide-associated complex protein [Candidatus Nanoarchaeia archaeon]|nr:nascent polypeptide-associated complex protein [Candidatus Nanoarchaeia archaeon]
MNPRDVQRAMKQLGVKQVEIPATEVIIRTAEKDIIIREPSVQKVNMMGQESFQITGEVIEQARSNAPEISEEDVKTVMEQAKVDRKTAQQAIQDAQGDLAQAIMNLNN